MTDDEFLAAFDSCTLPKPLWTHEAHVRLAWLCLDRIPFDSALAHVRTGIPKYNHSLGNTTGYHDTVTVAFLKIIAAKRTLGESFEDFRNTNPDVFSKARPVLLSYYSKAVLESEEARAGFVEADVGALPEEV
ncbi:MAG TPA: hypothetical protein VGJ05_13810 [Fimbriiglobus sp.]|jgi:hypothetical protein